MEFQLSCFKSWKMMLWKCCIQYTSKFGKLSSGHRTEKYQFSFKSQRKAILKNVQTFAQLHSSHKVMVKVMVKLINGQNSPSQALKYMNWEIPDVQIEFRKGTRTRDQIVNISWIIDKTRKFQKNVYFLFIDYTKYLVWITANYGNYTRDLNTRPSYLPPEKSVCRWRSNN